MAFGVFLSCSLALLDQLGQPAGPRQDGDGGRAAGVGVLGIIDVGVRLAGRGGRVEDLHRHLDGDVELALGLILEHHPDERRGLVAGAAAGAAQDGLGQLVQAELVHLAGEADLGVGIQPQAEEPLGRLAGAIEVAGQDGEPQRQLLAPLHRRVVQRLHAVGQGQRVAPLALLLEELGQVEPQVGLGFRRLGHLGELGDRLILLVVPPLDGAERQPGIDRVGRRLGRIGLAAEVADQVAQQVVALVELVGRAEELDRVRVEVFVRGREG